VVVLKQAAGLRLGGGAITVWCNGTAVLGDLGVDLDGMGQRLTTLSVRTATGRQVLEFDLEEAEPLAMLRRRFAGWASPVPQILASLRDDDLEVFPHTRHKVPRRWGHGRCVLLGDAVHGMPPVMAHGANQALEDVATLVDCLGTASDPAAAVRAYSSRRRRRAAWPPRSPRAVSRCPARGRCCRASPPCA
jgi:FAD binding domain